MTITFSRRLYASWVKNTNLLLVVVSGKLRSSYCSNSQCRRTGPQQVPFGFNLVKILGITIFFVFIILFKLFLST